MFIRRIILILVFVGAMTAGVIIAAGAVSSNADGIIEKARAACTSAGTSILDKVGQDSDDFAC